MSFLRCQEPGGLCGVEDQTALVHFGQGVCILLGDVAGYLDRSVILWIGKCSLCHIVREIVLPRGDFTRQYIMIGRMMLNQWDFGGVNELPDKQDRNVSPA